MALVHGNIRRLVNGLHRAKLCLALPTSCRLLAASTLCASASKDPLIPQTWNAKCATGKCSDCPGNISKVV